METSSFRRIRLRLSWAFSSLIWRFYLLFFFIDYVVAIEWTGWWKTRTRRNDQCVRRRFLLLFMSSWCCAWSKAIRRCECIVKCWFVPVQESIWRSWRLDHPWTVMGKPLQLKASTEFNKTLWNWYVEIWNEIALYDTLLADRISFSGFNTVKEYHLGGIVFSCKNHRSNNYIGHYESFFACFTQETWSRSFYTVVMPKHI